MIIQNIFLNCMCYLDLSKNYYELKFKFDKHERKRYDVGTLFLNIIVCQI